MIRQTGNRVNPVLMPTFHGAVSRIREVLVGERERILLLFGILLVGAIAFEAGFLAGVSKVTDPVVVSVPDSAVPVGGEVAGVATESAATKDATSSGGAAPGSCAFVGSRNSTLYHLPTCAVAKRIKPENVVCFSSAEDAQKKGYRAGCMK
ncbi:MAG: hypothetical protein HGA38_01540 [Candidatus Moranbacteria bacterium]|nr:hypothetical protein [Candidatus Moranbacteria bacterium]